MHRPKHTPPAAFEREVFDYIVVGAGATGCILANRLSADGSRTVCLLDAGPQDNNILLKVPAGVYRVPENPKFAWQFKTQPHPSTGNRRIALPQGRTLGGSTSINGMAYVRGSPTDFDEWAQGGNNGWAYQDVLPYFMRSERWFGAESHARGVQGELPVTEPDWRHPLCEAFIEAGGSFGLRTDYDYNADDRAGVNYYQRNIANGWRISAATAFLRPAASRRNLDIRTGALAAEVLFAQKRAVGIRYMPASGGPIRQVAARREVILSAGAINTPKILQLSGIGDPALLSEIGIPMVHGLPGVGGNFHDHYEIYLVMRVNVRTLSGRGLLLISEIVKWCAGRPSILSSCPSPVCGFINSHLFSAVPDTQLDVSIGNYGDRRIGRHPVLKVGFYKLKPRSRGFVHATSRDIYDDPVIQPAYLQDELDQQATIDGLKAVRQFLKAPTLQPYYVSEVLPGRGVEEDVDCLQYARTTGLAGHHVCGSCKMGPRNERMAVVDQELRVHGLEGLRIADASIMPSVPSANPSAAVFMIAEKASDMILGRRLQSANPSRVPSWRLARCLRHPRHKRHLARAAGC